MRWHVAVYNSTCCVTLLLASKLTELTCPLLISAPRFVLVAFFRMMSRCRALKDEPDPTFSDGGGLHWLPCGAAPHRSDWRKQRGSLIQRTPCERRCSASR